MKFSSILIYQIIIIQFYQVLLHLHIVALRHFLKSLTKQPRLLPLGINSSPPAPPGSCIEAFPRNQFINYHHTRDFNILDASRFEHSALQIVQHSIYYNFPLTKKKIVLFALPRRVNLCIDSLISKSSYTSVLCYIFTTYNHILRVNACTLFKFLLPFFPII